MQRELSRRAIELDPRFPHSHYDLALVYLSEKPYAQAVLPLQTCLRLNPQNAEAHLLLGRAYHNLNRTAPAIEEFRQALSLSTRLPLVHYRLGYALQGCPLSTIWCNLAHPAARAPPALPVPTLPEQDVGLYCASFGKPSSPRS